MSDELNLPKQYEDELRRLKAYFPFRFVFGYFDFDGEFHAHVVRTKSSMTRRLRGAMRRGEYTGQSWQL